MASGITGNGFTKIAELRAALDGDALRRTLLEGAAEKIAEVAAAQYSSGAGPDGASWPSNRNGTVPLVGLTSQVSFRATAAGVSASGPDALRYHENKRPVFPPQGTLSGPWAEAAEEGAAAAFEAAFGKG